MQLLSQQRNEFRSTFLSSLTRMLLNGGYMQTKHKSIKDARLVACAVVMIQKGKLPEEAVLGCDPTLAAIGWTWPLTSSCPFRASLSDISKLFGVPR